MSRFTFLKSRQLPSGSLTSKAWKSLKRNKIAVVSMWLIILAAVISIAGYLITPDNTPFANEQHLEIAARKPGFSTLVLKIRDNNVEVEQSWFRTMTHGKKSNFTYIPISSYKFQGNRIIVSLADENEPNQSLNFSYPLHDVLYSLVDTTLTSTNPVKLVDLEGNKITTTVAEMQHQVLKNYIEKRFYLLGTDRFGRDVLSQLMIGTRVSLSVGFISVLISLVLGILLGALAGFFRGWVDDLIIWFINVIWSIPTLLLVIAITFALGKGFWQVFIAVGLTMWVEVARVIRGQIISLREKEFVEAARALGYKNFRIIVRHILPNTMGPVIVISAANFASAILIEAGLSFLGIGVQPPMPSWGTMVKENYAYIILDNPWLALMPGIAIMILVLAFMLIGNGLRDALDVKTNAVF